MTFIKALLRLTYWGTQEHYDSTTEVEWGFGSLLGERDLMLHMMANYPLHWMAMSGDPYLTAGEAAKLYTDAMVPYNGDEFMIDYSDGPTGIYSDSKVKQVAWVKHYEKMWMGGGGFCGWRWPMCITNNTADRRGPTPEAEPEVLERGYGTEPHLCGLHGSGSQNLYTGQVDLGASGQAQKDGSISGLCL